MKQIPEELKNLSFPEIYGVDWDKYCNQIRNFYQFLQEMVPNHLPKPEIFNRYNSWVRVDWESDYVFFICMFYMKSSEATVEITADFQPGVKDFLPYEEENLKIDGNCDFIISNKVKHKEIKRFLYRLA